MQNAECKMQNCGYSRCHSERSEESKTGAVFSLIIGFSDKIIDGHVKKRG
jgi:hypothetical protein